MIMDDLPAVFIAPQDKGEIPFGYGPGLVEFPAPEDERVIWLKQVGFQAGKGQPPEIPLSPIFCLISIVNSLPAFASCTS